MSNNNKYAIRYELGKNYAMNLDMTIDTMMLYDTPNYKIQTRA